MKIENGKHAILSYKLTSDTPDGEFIEQTNEQEPYELIIGKGDQLEAFERGIMGLKAGDSFSFGINSKEAFGAYDESAVVTLPKSTFEHEGKIDESLFKMHQVLPMKDADGDTYNGTIIAISEADVTLDFNHPLADENLWFSGQIIEVKDID